MTEQGDECSSCKSGVMERDFVYYDGRIGEEYLKCSWCGRIVSLPPRRGHVEVREGQRRLI